MKVLLVVWSAFITKIYCVYSFQMNFYITLFTSLPFLIVYSSELCLLYMEYQPFLKHLEEHPKDKCIKQWKSQLIILTCIHMCITSLYLLFEFESMKYTCNIGCCKFKFFFCFVNCIHEKVKYNLNAFNME